MRKAHPYQIENMLSPKWTGPFRVIEVLGNNAYKLETPRGDPSHEHGMRQISSFISVKIPKFALFFFEHYVSL